MDDEQQQRRTPATLPDELVCSHILPRLQAPDLARFKFLCKPWFTTISDPEFQNSHLTRQTPGRIEPHQGALLYTNPQHSETVVLSLAYFGKPQPLLSPFTSCNGLVVGGLKLDKTDPEATYCITNPVTGRYKELPLPPDRIQHFFLHFDDSSDQYSLFAWNSYNQNIYLLEFKTELAWRKLSPKRCHDWLIDFCPPVVLGGCLYWTVARWATGPAYKWTVLAVDTKSKEFREIKVPVPVAVDAYDLGMVYRLTVTEGFLYLIKKHKYDSNVGDQICHVIWRLESEEGPMWTKIYQHIEDHCAECNGRRLMKDCSSTWFLEDCTFAYTQAEAKKIRDSCVYLYKSASNLYDSVPHTNSLIWY